MSEIDWQSAKHYAEKVLLDHEGDPFKLVPCNMSRALLAADAELATLRKQLAEAEKARDGFKTRAQVAESSIRRAVGAAHDSMPDYPWNTVKAGEELSSACWAWAQGLKGTQMACDDLHAALTGRPTGQSILDELSAARKLLDRARQLAVQSCAIEGDEWGTLAANIDAARKANTGDGALEQRH